MQSRRRRIRALAVGVATATVLAAGQALASEGNLVLLPSVKMLGALIALFLILIFPVDRLVFRPIFAVLDAREDTIAGTRRRAETLAAQAEEILARYETSIRQVREEAEHDRKGRLAAARAESAAQAAEARAEAEREIERAHEQISAELVAARGKLRSEARGLGREAAARVLGRALS